MLAYNTAESKIVQNLFKTEYEVQVHVLDRWVATDSSTDLEAVLKILQNKIRRAPNEQWRMLQRDIQTKVTEAEIALQ